MRIINNCLNKPEYAETLKQMKEYLWSWLESENDPILKGKIPPPQSWKESIKQYEQWKKSKG